MTHDIYQAEPLSTGRASSLLHDAWIVDDESMARVHSACVHRVLVLEVEAVVEGTYRSGIAGGRRIVVGTFELLRKQYLARFNAGAAPAWQAGEPPEWLGERVRACLDTAGLQNVRITSWAEEDVVEVHWQRMGPRGNYGAGQLDFLGTSPARRVGNDRGPEPWAPYLVGPLLVAGAFTALFMQDQMHDRDLVGVVIFTGIVLAAMAAWLRRWPIPPRIASTMHADADHDDCSDDRRADT